MTRSKRTRRAQARELGRRCAVNPLRIDTIQKIACALNYWIVVEIPEGANEDVHYGRFLFMDALIYALETLPPPGE